MNIEEIYNLIIKMGIDSDFRGEDGIKKFLENKKKKYEKMDEKEKQGIEIITCSGLIRISRASN